ncbi:Dimethylaniline monooxygenase [N-oxide-forming] [Aphelenchoides fujianensis]|nr:Dimethylaniline monooxygenase [N-oxide-forming] [Aphelenchoides fujianensis]KAI6222321.1 Dimethylaniline monooxygenase [N-oxide-forming] [Aphelenchoides fujianensis]
MRVCVIGAGVSGVPTAKWGLQFGHEVVVFEATDSIGGLWKYKPDETEFGTVMKSTCINTSKEMSFYSDFPFPADTPNFPHHTRFLKHLKDYADFYKVTPCVRFKHKVTNVVRAEDYATSGRWIVYFRDSNGTAKKEYFDLVCVATGHHAKPIMPTFPGQEKFKGRIIHSHSYKHHVGYENKTVCVVGIGNSAVDIACELSRVADQVYLSTRRGAWILVKTFDGAYPMDLWYNRRIHVWLKHALPRLFVWVAHRRFNQEIDHDVFKLRPKHNIMAQHPTMSDELLAKLNNGTVRVKPNIREFTADGLVFEDDSRVERVDEVVLSTGYSFDYSFLDGGQLVPTELNRTPLYKMIFPLNAADKNTLGIFGLLQPLGTAMAMVEMQARYFFAHHGGHFRLPPPAEMRAEAERVAAERAKRYVPTPRHTVQLDYTEYMEDLSQKMGARPNLLYYLVTDPVLFYALVFGPDLPAVYRLQGLHAHPKARRWILDVNKRIRHQPTTEEEGGGKTNKRSASFLIAAALLLGLVVARFGTPTTRDWLQAALRTAHSSAHRALAWTKGAAE